MRVGVETTTMAPGPSGVAAGLLDELQLTHARVSAAMDVMESVTRDPIANESAYKSARWRLSQASLARRTVWLKCSAHLAPLVDSRGQSILATLRSTDLALQRCSAAHVGRWTSSAIEADWQGYCSASRAIRSEMASAIESEKLLLYPLLARYAEIEADRQRSHPRLRA